MNSTLDGKLPDTYIYIRIFDSTIDKPPPFSFIKKNCSLNQNANAIPRPLKSSNKHNKVIDSKWDGVILLVLSAPYASNERCGRTVFPGVRNKTLYDRYLTGYDSGQSDPAPTVTVTPDEVVVILKQMMEWIRGVFSPYSSIKRLIDLKYAYCYRDTEGFCVSVDGLYNMTDAINYNILESIPLKNRSAVSNGEMNTTSLQNSKGTSKKELGSHAAHINIKKHKIQYTVMSC